MNSHPSKKRCNGPAVIRLRSQLSMTQEKLAALSKVSIRTVQRAEKGELLQIETLADLAASLKVPMSEILIEENLLGEKAQTNADLDKNAVVLRRIRSGKDLLDILLDSFSGTLGCDAEPTDSNISVLGIFLETVEGFMPNPWVSPIEYKRLTLADRLRQALAITRQLNELETFGICVFAGTYTAKAQIPRYSSDTGDMYLSGGISEEFVTICKVVVGKVGPERVVVSVNDKWTEDDEIPF